MKIRDEKPSDIYAIHELTKTAFAQVEYSDGSEPHIIDKLRSDGDLRLSLVAVDDDGNLVGHVAFSPVSVGTIDEQWYGLGPIAVDVGKQKSGIGSQLINEGLRQLRSSGAGGCILVGDSAYYGRFGFKNDGKVTYSEMPSEFVQWLAFQGTVPTGEIVYPPAFGTG